MQERRARGHSIVVNMYNCSPEAVFLIEQEPCLPLVSMKRDGKYGKCLKEGQEPVVKWLM